MTRSGARISRHGDPDEVRHLQDGRDRGGNSATVTLSRGETVVVVKGTPAEICRNCGEYYLDEAVAGWVYATAQSAADRHAEVEILRCAA